MNNQNIFGFRRLHSDPTKERPPQLRQYKIIDNYQIYQPDFNQLVFVIHDEENDLYYRLERTNTEIEKTDLNLQKWIEILFKM